MGEAKTHDVTTCARAWQTLRMAHDRVAHRLAADLARDCAIAVNEFDVLLHLRLRGAEPVRPRDLLDTVSLSQPALSRLTARLEARGLLTRCDATSDGRATLLRLTGSGTALIDRAVAVHARAVHETLIGKFSPSEQAALLETLSRIGP